MSDSSACFTASLPVVWLFALGLPALALAVGGGDALVALVEPGLGLQVREHEQLAGADRAHHALADPVGIKPALEVLVQRIVRGDVERAAEARRPVLRRQVDARV